MQKGPSLGTTLYNGASIADWLGTAAVAARIAAERIEGIRSGDYELDVPGLVKAQRSLLQSMSELVTVLNRVDEA